MVALSGASRFHARMLEMPPTLRRWAKRLATGTRLGQTAYKTFLVTSVYRRSALAHPLDAVRFVLVDPELANFTYDIANRDELIDFVARQLGVDRALVRRYADELAGDGELADRLAKKLATRRDRKRLPLYGRRIGWYCIVRIKKPRLLVETGVADGLGSAVLVRAAERNAAEGAPCRVIGIDIDPSVGWLLDDELRRRHELVIEDSHTALPRLLAGQSLDLFIHDSAHTYEHEADEYRLVAPHLAPDAIVLSDNAHAVPALEDFARAAGRPFAFFREQPLRHFYPGAGIGLSLPATAKRT